MTIFQETAELQPEVMDTPLSLLKMGFSKEEVSSQDGNGAPKPASPWVFTLLGDGDGHLFIPAGLLLGTLYNPTRFVGLHPFR